MRNEIQVSQRLHVGAVLENTDRDVQKREEYHQIGPI
jgi:hypothetical protein